MCIQINCALILAAVTCKIWSYGRDKFKLIMIKIELLGNADYASTLIALKCQARETE